MAQLRLVNLRVQFVQTNLTLSRKVMYSQFQQDLRFWKLL